MLPKALKRLQDTLALLPGIGDKTALKLAFFLFDANDRYTQELSGAVGELKSTLAHCPRCHGYMDQSALLCQVCSDESRDESVLMVTEEYLDMLTIERSGAYRGYYHILGGCLSPVHGKRLEHLEITSLIERVRGDKSIKELILAVNPNLEGEATALYILKHLEGEKDIHISRLSKGLPNATYIEYADDITIINALSGRTQSK